MPLRSEDSMGNWVDRNKGPRSRTSDTSGEIRNYDGKPHFCRSPQFENVFIVPVSDAGEEYQGDQGRTIPRSVWCNCTLVK